MPAFPLIDLLRRRRALPVEDLWQLLSPLPALLDDAAERDELPRKNLLTSVNLVFTVPVDSKTACRPVREWPAFRLRLPTGAKSGDAQATVINLGGVPGDDAVARFAALIHGLLGGAHRTDGAFSPVTALSEDANSVLRRALLGNAFASCAEFWREFLRTSEGDWKIVRIPGSCLGLMPVGDVLRLIPGGAAPPIHLVARPQFRIGRSHTQADWIARIQPATPENERRTNNLSRVHVLGELSGGKPALRDGNGEHASVNGSTFDALPLAADQLTPVRHEALLRLGEHFTLKVLPLLAAGDDFLVENLAEWSGFGRGEPVPEPHGAVVFAPPAVEPIQQEAVWMFTRLDFCLRRLGGLEWMPPSRKNPASFLRYGGCFWLVNAGLPTGAVRLGVDTLERGEAAPLTSGQTLQLGAERFTLELGSCPAPPMSGPASV